SIGNSRASTGRDLTYRSPPRTARCAIFRFETTFAVLSLDRWNDTGRCRTEFFDLIRTPLEWLRQVIQGPPNSRGSGRALYRSAGFTCAPVVRRLRSGFQATAVTGR